jgi:GMP synthase-like glutamine amidotransferase
MMCSFVNLGGNALTPVQAMAKDARIITFQGHPEYEATALRLREGKG